MNTIQRLTVSVVVGLLGFLCVYPVGFATTGKRVVPRGASVSIFPNGKMNIPQLVGNDWIWNLEMVHPGYTLLEAVIIVSVGAAVCIIWND